jgi:uncharacterized protein YjdB
MMITKMNKNAIAGWIVWSLIGVLFLIVVAGLYFAFQPSSPFSPNSPISNNIQVNNSNPIVPSKVALIISNVSPSDLSKNQATYSNVVVIFAEAMSPSSVNENTFFIIGPNNTILNGTITSDVTNKTWTLNPNSSFKLNTVYTVTITTGAKSIVSHSLNNNFVWSFKTIGSSGGGGGSSSSESATLTTIRLTPTTSNLTVDSSQQLSATGYDQNSNSISATITYTTSNSSSATVNAISGLVTAVAVGNATITATSGSITNTTIILVTAAPVLTTITLTPSTANLTVNVTQRLISNATDQSSNVIATTINYTSSNLTVATVNSSGYVRALAIGNATITAANGTVNDTTLIYVVGSTAIMLTPTTANLTINSTKQMNATDQLGNSITLIISYTSSNTSVATVNATSGLVTAFAEGNTTINASSAAISNTSLIYVVSLINITLSPTTANITVESTKQMNATDQLNNSFVSGAINYTSSNTSVATVNSTTGLVTAVALGNTTITGLHIINGTVNDTSIIYVESTSSSCLTTAVDLGTAGNFAILAKSGISTTGVTAITGDIGVSPAASTYMTGFGLILDSSTTFSTSSLITGRAYAASYTAPTPSTMTTAVSDMETAYTDAAGRTNPCFTELGDGNIGGLTLAPGLYTWGTDLIIPSTVTLSGNSTDIWVFQIAGTLGISSATNVTLTGGAQAKNVFWQVAGQTTLGTTSVFNGNILSGPGVAVDEAIVLSTGATLNGRALSQKAVTLDANAVTKSV